jgi:CRISPR-associated protein Csa3
MRVLISTMEEYEPVMSEIKYLSPEKVILIRDAATSRKLDEVEKRLMVSFPKVVEFEVKKTDISDIIAVAKHTVGVIEKEHKKNNEILVCITESFQELEYGVLFGAYARSHMVSRVMYVMNEDLWVIDLPVLSFGLSETKKNILHKIDGGVKPPEIGKKLGITRGMVYNHIRELKKAGYIDDKMKVRDSGRLAMI